MWIHHLNPLSTKFTSPHLVPVRARFRLVRFLNSRNFSINATISSNTPSSIAERPVRRVLSKQLELLGHRYFAVSD
jgi:hypothetical protein